ncbi:MAG: TonB-dependent receptor [Chitinophagales bacterium]
MQSHSSIFQKLLFSLLFMVLFVGLSAQNKYTLSGYMRDASSGEDIFAGNVFVRSEGKGTTSNEYGFYSLTLPEGVYQVEYTYLGMKPKIMEITLDEDVKLNINLEDASIIAEEVVITGERQDANVDNADIGTVELDTRKAKEIPALLGEIDIMKTLQLMPGVMSAGEGNSGLYVRGGGPDQNLVLLDNAIVYNPGHLLGFFSVFNADAIKSTTLIKGGIPANYGGRISSVLDLSMKEGNMKEWGFEGGIGLLSARLTAQGPLKKDVSSMIVSGRLTYFSFLANPLARSQQKENGDDGAVNIPWFFDVNAKFNYKFSDKDRLYVSSYIGRDRFSFSGGGDLEIELPWGNSTATMRWNHLFNDKMFMNTTFVFNDYTSKIDASFGDLSFKLNSGIRDIGLKGQLDFYPVPTHKLKFGYDYMYHIFTPELYEVNTGDETFTTEIQKKKAHEFAVYLTDEMDVADWLKINAGVRVSMFSNVGPYKRIYYENGSNIPTDTVEYKGSDGIATYFGVEPRLNARFRTGKSSSIKLGFNLNKQYVHLASNTSTTFPTDIWVPSTDLVKPQTGIQASLGYFQNFHNDDYETSVEVYYKRIWNMLDYGESAVPGNNREVEDYFVNGDGYSYGAEFFLKKRYGKFNGWIGYTLAWSDRKFDAIDNGEKFYAKYDRRHDLSIVLIYDINEKWKLSGTFIYGTGQTTTLPINRYTYNGKEVNEYGDRNWYRMPAYHRMDIGATFIMKDNDKRYSDLNFSIYNLYNRANPYFIFNEIEGDISGLPDGESISVQAKQVSLFPILPSITWNFRY